MPSARVHFVFRIALVLMLYLGLLSGCSSSPERTATGNSRQDALAEASRMLGTPYRYGGRTPRGFDCSGLVYYAYRKAGIAVPRSTRDQYRQAAAIPVSRMQPGDLLFFRIHGREVSHVAIYAGQGRMLHAPSQGKQVSYERLDNPYWRQRLAGAGRYD